jgi:hypothetical protein
MTRCGRENWPGKTHKCCCALFNATPTKRAYVVESEHQQGKEGRKEGDVIVH